MTMMMAGPSEKSQPNHPPVLFHNGSGVERKGKGAVYTVVYKFPQFAKAKRSLLQETLQVTLQELDKRIEVPGYLFR